MDTYSAAADNKHNLLDKIKQLENLNQRQRLQTLQDRKIDLEYETTKHQQSMQER